MAKEKYCFVRKGYECKHLGAFANPCQKSQWKYPIVKFVCTAFRIEKNCRDISRGKLRKIELVKNCNFFEKQVRTNCD